MQRSVSRANAPLRPLFDGRDVVVEQWLDATLRKMLMRTLTSHEMNDVAGGYGYGYGGRSQNPGFGTLTVTQAGGVTTVTATATTTAYGPFGGGTVTRTLAGGVLTCTSTFTGSIGGFLRC